MIDVFLRSKKTPVKKMTEFLQGYTPLWMVALGITSTFLLIIVCFWLTLRHIDSHTTVIKKAAIDLMLNHQEINKMIADVSAKAQVARDATLQQTVINSAAEVTTKAEDAARDVRTKVVTEAEEVRDKVDKAAIDAQQGFVAGAAAVNEKLDVILGHGADDTNRKLDDLLVKSDKPILVEVVNEPLVTRVVAEEKKRK